MLPDYYAQLLALMETVFTQAVLDEAIEPSANGWLDAATAQQMKNFAGGRRANVSAHNVPMQHG